MWTRENFAKMSRPTQQICGRIGRSRSDGWRLCSSAFVVAQRPDPVRGRFWKSLLDHVEAILFDCWGNMAIGHGSCEFHRS